MENGDLRPLGGRSSAPGSSGPAAWSSGDPGATFSLLSKKLRLSHHLRPGKSRVLPGFQEPLKTDL